MKTLVSWFVRNPVAANLLMILLIVGGIAGALTAKIELFPEFSLDMVTVAVPYPGAAPEDVEEGICVPIEEEVHAIEGVERLTSVAVEGMGSVTIEVAAGADPRRVLDDVKTRVDAIESFPEEAEEPVIEAPVIRRQVVNVAIFGDAGEATLKRVGERVRDEISALEGISQVELAATRDYEVSVEVSEAALRRHGLTFDEVAMAIREGSLDLAGGTVKTEGGEILLRTKAQAYRGEDFGRLVLLTREDGTRVLLDDVATVVDGFVDTDQWATFNGKPMALVQVFRVGDESALGVSEAVHDYIERTRPTLPAGIGIEPWQDNATILESRLDLLLKNGFQGLVLVFLVLALFLRFRLSFWVTLGIPISFLGTLAVMPSLGVSLNMLSLFALILVLGIVVDDAIVVGENVYNEHERGVIGPEGAVRGVRGVTIPVAFAILTTVVAFLPMVGLPGIFGKFFAVIPMTVIPALLFSLVESMFILPAHLSHASVTLDRLSAVPPFSWWSRFQRRSADGMDWTIRRVYTPVLERALEWRYATVALALAAMAATVGLVRGGFVDQVFFPEIEADLVAAQVTMPQGTSSQVTARAVQRLEDAALRLRDELEESEGGSTPVIVNLMATVGEQPYKSQQQRLQTGGIVGSQYGEVVIELAPSEERDLTSTRIAARWRELCGPIAGAVEQTFESSLMASGQPINVEFSGTDVGRLRSAAHALEAELAGYPGVSEVMDTFRGGKEELVLDVRPEAESLGLTQRALARQVRQAFHGEEAQRFQRGRDEVKVMVRYPEEDRRTLHGLETMRLRTPGGGEVPFSTVADVETRQGYATIRRADRRRTVTVTADVDEAVGNASEVLASLEAEALPRILADHPGVQFRFEGQNREQREIAASMSRLMALALIGIYALMAIPFRSYAQPLIVMTAIPFGVVGAVLGHLAMDLDLSMMSVLGIAALAGVVVNDSLVLVDFVNRQHEDEGRSREDAARTAGILRFRPIMLTSLTTFAGLTPLMLERSVQAQFLVPMAASLAFGVMFSTLITLLFVPASYLILGDVERAFRWLYGGAREADATSVPTAG